MGTEHPAETLRRFDLERRSFSLINEAMELFNSSGFICGQIKFPVALTGLTTTTAHPGAHQDTYLKKGTIMADKNANNTNNNTNNTYGFNQGSGRYEHSSGGIGQTSGKPNPEQTSHGYPIKPSK